MTSSSREGHKPKSIPPHPSKASPKPMRHSHMLSSLRTDLPRLSPHIPRETNLQRPKLLPSAATDRALPALTLASLPQAPFETRVQRAPTTHGIPLSPAVLRIRTGNPAGLHSLCHARGGKSTKPSLKFPKPDKHTKTIWPLGNPTDLFRFTSPAFPVKQVPCYGPARPQQNLQQQESGSPVGQGWGRRAVSQLSPTSLP